MAKQKIKRQVIKEILYHALSKKKNGEVVNLEMTAKNKTHFRKKAKELGYTVTGDVFLGKARSYMDMQQ